MGRAYARIFAAILVVAGCGWSDRATAGDFEDALRARWRGAWVVLGTEVYSSCSGGYDTNSVSGQLVTARSGYRFLPGELGKVERVQLKKKKIDLMLTLDVPYRVSRQDGPFTLYDQSSCGVSLEIELPRELTRARDVPAIDGLVAHLVKRFDTRESALRSRSWNGREVEPFPEDYDRTLARHAAWQAEQLNLAIDQRRQVALQQVTVAGRAIHDDPEYLQGLAAGAEVMKAWSVRDCTTLLARGFDSARRRPPDDRRGDAPDDERWRHGFEDGQRLVYNIALLERLDRCYVPVPAVPGEDWAAQDRAPAGP